MTLAMDCFLWPCLTLTMDSLVLALSSFALVDTDGVDPLIFMSESINVLREDVSKVTVSQEDALKNAANHDSDYFKIAKVLRQ